MDNLFIYLVIAQIIIIAIIVGVKMVFNYFENKKIQSILEFIDKRANENKDGRADRIKECIDILKTK